MKSSEDRFVESIRAVLDRSADSVDPSTAEALRRARERALAAAGQARAGSPRRLDWLTTLWARPRLLVPVAALATLVLVVTLALFPTPQPAPGVAQAPEPGLVVNDLALLESEENLPMMQDLDFLLWLDDEQLDG